MSLYQLADGKRTVWDQNLTVSFNRQPFGTGGMRKAHLASIFKDKRTIVGKCVFKYYMQGANCYEKIAADAAMQSLCQRIAEAYNKAEIGNKPVHFCQVLFGNIPSRSHWFSIEEYLEGKVLLSIYSNCSQLNSLFLQYEKHNSNFGTVHTDRMTPQAFSHFSYVATKGSIMIVDMQGVGDKYTDPQVHSHEPHGLGEGDLGVYGMNAFLETHVCNELCRGLPPLPKKVEKLDDTKLDIVHQYKHTIRANIATVTAISKEDAKPVK